MSAPKWTPSESVHSTPIVTRKIERDGRLVCMVSAGASAQDWALLQAAPDLFEALKSMLEAWRETESALDDGAGLNEAQNIMAGSLAAALSALSRAAGEEAKRG